MSQDDSNEHGSDSLNVLRKDGEIIKNKMNEMTTVEKGEAHNYRENFSDIDSDIVSEMVKSIGQGENIFDQSLAGIDSDIVEEMTNIFGESESDVHQSKDSNKRLTDEELLNVLNSINSDDELVSDFDNENDRLYDEETDEELNYEHDERAPANENNGVSYETEVNNLSWVDQAIQKTIKFEKNTKITKDYTNR